MHLYITLITRIDAARHWCWQRGVFDATVHPCISMMTRMGAARHWCCASCNGRQGGVFPKCKTTFQTCDELFDALIKSPFVIQQYATRAPALVPTRGKIPDVNIVVCTEWVTVCLRSTDHCALQNHQRYSNSRRCWGPAHSAIERHRMHEVGMVKAYEDSKEGRWYLQGR